MNIGRRDFIKYGVIGVSAAALLRPVAAAPASGAASSKDTGYGTFMRPSGKEAYIADRPLAWWIGNYHLPLHIYFAPIITANVRAFRKVFKDL